MPTKAEVNLDGSVTDAEQHPFMAAQQQSTTKMAARRKLREWTLDGVPSKPASNTEPEVQSSGGSHDGHGHKHGHQCVHDLIVNAIDESDHPARRPSFQNYGHAGAETVGDAEPRSEGRKLSGSSEFQTMRIHLDTTSFDFTAANPEKNSKGQIVSCYGVGQTYTPTLAATSSQTSTCSEADILSPEKKNYLLNEILPEAVQWFR